MEGVLICWDPEGFACSVRVGRVLVPRARMLVKAPGPPTTSVCPIPLAMPILGYWFLSCVRKVCVLCV